MNADGSGLTKISNTPPPGVERVPSSADCEENGLEVQSIDDPNVSVDPVLSPDCKRIAFSALRILENTYSEIYVTNADGTGPKTRLTKGHVDYVLDWLSE